MTKQQNYNLRSKLSVKIKYSVNDLDIVHRKIDFNNLDNINNLTFMN